MKEIHPPHVRIRLLRELRRMSRVRGWRRLAGLVTATASGSFVVGNNVRGVTTYFAGEVSSFIDREMYLFGNYEEDQIAEFVSLVPSQRRGVLLDVGANVGTHSLAFSRHFRRVHAFEPNSRLWASFERNVAINGLQNVTLHRVGLADRDADLRFFSIAKKNFGLGTFSTIEQYDLPLKETQTATVVLGDRYVPQNELEAVDAIKLDVQGFEREVLRGLSETLKAHRPFVWFEVSHATRSDMGTAERLKAIFPYPFDLYRFKRQARVMTSRIRLRPAIGDTLQEGDYVLAPRVSTAPDEIE